MVRSEEAISPNVWVPVSVNADAGFILRDEAGQLANVPEMVISAHTAVSAPQYIPFRPAPGTP